MTPKNTPPTGPYQPSRTTRKGRRPTVETPVPATQTPPSIEEEARDQQVPTRINKTDAVVAMLRRPDGASVDEIMVATGWQRHSVRGALAGAVKRKLAAAVTSEMIDGVRHYRAPEAAA